MKIRFYTPGATLLVLALATWMAPAAGAQPLYDVVHVNMPYTVTINNKTLPPGDYTIKQESGMAGDNGVLLIYSDNGMKFETSAMTFKALDTNTPEDTKIVLHHIGDDYYFDKMWVQGKDYGYEFPLPAKVKAREKELMAQAVTVPASVGPTAPANTTAANTSASETTPTETNPTPTTSAQATPPSTVDNSSSATPAVTPTTPDTDTEPAAEPNTDMQPPNPPNDDQQPATDGATTPATPKSMPSTSAGWLMMLLGGGTLSSAGALLRRRSR